MILSRILQFYNLITLYNSWRIITKKKKKDTEQKWLSDSTLKFFTILQLSHFVQFSMYILLSKKENPSRNNSPLCDRGIEDYLQTFNSLLAKTLIDHYPAKSLFNFQNYRHFIHLSSIQPRSFLRENRNASRCCKLACFTSIS